MVLFIYLTNLSQKEYTERVSKLMDCTTLQELGKLYKEMENAIRTVIKEQRLYEGLMRPSPMGVLIDEAIPLEKVPKGVLEYCKLRDIPLIQVSKESLEKPTPQATPQATQSFVSDCSC